jgi:hypothetical protein
MDTEDGGETSVRRSGRRKKEISYKDLEAKSPNAATPEDPVEEEEEEEEEEPDEDEPFIDEVVPGRRGRKRRVVDDNDPAAESSGKRSGIGARGWDDRLYALAGTEPAAMASMAEKVEKWKDVVARIPDELVDYTVGWCMGIGNWRPGGDERQKVDFIESRLVPIF